MTAAAGNLLMGYPIYNDPGQLVTPTYSGGSWPTLPLTNLSTRYLAEVARSASAALADTRFKCDLKADRTIRVVAIPKHTLSSAAYVRVLGYPSAMLFDYEAGEDASLLSGYSFTRATTATYVDRNGIVRTATSGTLRDSHFIGGVRHTLLEPARTNIAVRSEDMSDAAWGKTNITVTTNATAAPDGAATADKVAATAGAATVFAQSIVAAGATAWTFSIFVKRGSGDTDCNAFGVRNSTTATDLCFITFNYATGIVTGGAGGTVTVDTLGTTGWYRINIAVSSGITAGNTVQCYAGFTGASETAGEYAYVWGGQLEAGAYASSYIPTTTVAVARNADVLAFGSVASGTLYNHYWDLATRAYVESASVWTTSTVALATGVAYVAARIATGTVNLANMAAMVYDSGWIASYPAGQTAETLEGLNVPFVQIVNGQTGFSGRYWSVQIDDASNSAGYVDLSRLCVCAGWQPDSNMQLGARPYLDTSTTAQETDGSSFIYNARSRRRNFQITLPFMAESDVLAYPWQMQRILGSSGQFFFVWSPTGTTTLYEWSCLAVFRELSQFDYAFFNRLHVPLSIREEL